MLDQEQIRRAVHDLWILHDSERYMLDRIHGYVSGMLGAPEVPEAAGQEVKHLAALSIKNVLGLVRDSFVDNLSVTGFRNALAKDNTAAWRIWQRNRMDARQAEIYRPAITYGAAYVVVVDGPDGTVWRTRSPRQLLAVYEDPQVDLWPQYAFETWIDQSDAKPRRRAVLYDDEYMYPLDLGTVPVLSVDSNSTTEARQAQITEFGEPIRHGSDVCPVVRFVNGRDADVMIVGEIAPLIRLQQAINEVNFDRLITVRFGAFPQKVISGWSGSASEVLSASARRVWSFEDTDVKVDSFPAANPEAYNLVLEEMLHHMAMVAQISPAQVTGKLVNLSAEALAAAEANQQRKLQSKRDSFGESWEQVFRLAASMEGDAATAEDDEAEVQWRDTEARSFGAIIDGATKLAAVGVPLEELVDLIPGITQQKVQAIKDALRRTQVNNLVAALQQVNPSAANGDGTAVVTR